MDTSQNFRNTTLNLIVDVSEAYQKSPTDKVWVYGFVLPMIGNLAHECGEFRQMEEGNPTVKGSLGGISFAQWTGMTGTGRRKLFMAFCREMKLHPYSYEAALGFILRELNGAYKRVISATLNATVQQNTPNPKTEMMAKMVRFEVIYEGAGIKHYPGRYERAVKAAGFYEAWMATGMPKPGPFVMPKARFQKEFDEEFGNGVGRVTRRIDSTKIAAPAAPVAQLLPDEVDQVVVLVETANDGLPPVRIQSGRWPEQLLSMQEVKAIQTALKNNGFVRVGTIDGKWGGDTIGAVSALQTEAGIEVDGHYGPATRNALMGRVKKTVSAARSSATAEKLKAAGDPTVQQNAQVKSTSQLATIGAAGSTAIAGIASYFPNAVSGIQFLRDAFSEVPGWVWFALVGGVAAFLWFRSQKVEKIAVDQYRDGSNTSLDAPLPTPDRPYLNESASQTPASALTDQEFLAFGHEAAITPEDRKRLLRLMNDRS